MPRHGTPFHNHAGIAVGPLLFIVAILAVLIGALASSGGFGSSSSRDTAKTQVSVLIQQGTSLKMGFDRLFGAGLLPGDIIYSSAYSTGQADNALFSPSGGQMVLPAAAPGAVPTTGIITWRYVVNASLPTQGAAGGDLTAVIGVFDLAHCQQINGILFGATAVQAMTVPTPSTPLVPVLNDTGTCTDVVSTTTTAGCDLADNTFDLSNYTAIDGRSQACISDGGSPPAYYYYQALRVQ